MSGHVHRYAARVRWRGSTAGGYEGYDRAHSVTAPPAEAELAVSSDPAFAGDARLLNPEQLIVAAASSCQLLEFLAIAARSGVEVLAYSDDAEGEMPEGDPPERIERIVLRPRIEVAEGPTEERVRRIAEKAHEGCYVANSLRTEIEVEPEIAFRPPTGAR